MSSFVKKLPPLICITAASLLVLYWLAPVCLANEPDPGNGGQSGTWDNLKMMGQVIIYLLLIIGLFYVLIRFLARKNRAMGFGNSVRSIGGVPLGQNKSIQIVEIGRSLYIVGVGNNIQLLEKIEESEEVEYLSQLLTSSRSGAPVFGSFGNLIKKAMNRNSKDEEEDDMQSSFQQMFQDKLQQVSSRRQNVELLMKTEKRKDRLNDE